MDACLATATLLLDNDADLACYLEELEAEINEVINDHKVINQFLQNKSWNKTDLYNRNRHKRELSEIPSISDRAKKEIISKRVDFLVDRAQQEGKNLTWVGK